MNTALQTLDRSIAQFHQHQAETLRVHEQFLNNQVALLKNSSFLSPAANSAKCSLPIMLNLRDLTTEGISSNEKLSNALSAPQVTIAGGNGSKPEFSMQK